MGKLCYKLRLSESDIATMEDICYRELLAWTLAHKLLCLKLTLIYPIAIWIVQPTKNMNCSYNILLGLLIFNEYVDERAAAFLTGFK